MSLSVSNSLHFTVYFLDGHGNQFSIKRCLCCKSNRIPPSVLLYVEKKSSIAVLRNCAYKKNQECTVDFKNRKEWIHFVGIGGCGMSALAKLALKQVNYFFFHFFKTLT